MKAVKANKIYMIDEAQQKSYQDMGYDILDDDGTTIAYGRGKTVPYDDHMKAVSEIKNLQNLAAERNAENKALKAELAALKENGKGPESTDKKEAGKKAGA